MKHLKLFLIAAALSGCTTLPASAASMPNPAVLTTNGDYDITGVTRGRTETLMVSGTWGTATLNLQFYNNASSAWETIKTFNSGAPVDSTGFVHIASGSTARINIASASGTSLNIQYFACDPLAKRTTSGGGGSFDPTAPGPIGGGTPGSGNFTSLTTSGTNTFNSATDSTTTGTGALILAGGAGIAKNVNVGGTFTAAGISGTPVGSPNPSTVAATTLSANSITSGVYYGVSSGITLQPNGSGSTTGRVTIDGTTGTMTTLGSFAASSTTDATSGGAGAITTAGGIYSAKSQYSATTMTAATSLNAPKLKGTGNSLVFEPNSGSTTGAITIDTSGNMSGMASASATNIVASNNVSAGSLVGVVNRGGLRASADAVYTLKDNANSAFGSLALGQISDGAKSLAAAGATGNRSANSMVGSIRLAAGNSSATLTNTLITTTSVMCCSMKGNDASARDVRYTTGSGTATIFVAVAPAAELEITYVIFN